jgi:hypothetical protein
VTASTLEGTDRHLEATSLYLGQDRAETRLVRITAEQIANRDRHDLGVSGRLAKRETLPQQPEPAQRDQRADQRHEGDDDDGEVRGPELPAQP